MGATACAASVPECTGCAGDHVSSYSCRKAIASCKCVDGNGHAAAAVVTSCILQCAVEQVRITRRNKAAASLLGWLVGHKESLYIQISTAGKRPLRTVAGKQDSSVATAPELTEEVWTWSHVKSAPFRIEAHTNTEFTLAVLAYQSSKWEEETLVEMVGEARFRADEDIVPVVGLRGTLAIPLVEKNRVRGAITVSVLLQSTAVIETAMGHGTKTAAQEALSTGEFRVVSDEPVHSYQTIFGNESGIRMPVTRMQPAGAYVADEATFSHDGSHAGHALDNAGSTPLEEQHVLVEQQHHQQQEHWPVDQQLWPAEAYWEEPTPIIHPEQVNARTVVQDADLDDHRQLHGRVEHHSEVQPSSWEADLAVVANSEKRRNSEPKPTSPSRQENDPNTLQGASLAPW